MSDTLARLATFGFVFGVLLSVLLNNAILLYGAIACGVVMTGCLLHWMLDA